MANSVHTPSRFEDLTKPFTHINETHFRLMMGELRYPRQPLTQEERNDLASALEHLREAAIDLAARKAVEL